MTIPELLIQYEARLRELQIAAAQARFHSTIAAAALAISVALLLMLSLYAVRPRARFWWPGLSAPLVVASARRYRLSRQSRYRMSRLEQFYRRSVERIQGNWAGSGAGGEEFSDSDHVYSSDLDVFGEGSLFELLCTVRTANGKRGLADFLLTVPPIEEILSRQEAVRELRGRVDLREQITLLGKFEFLESKWETFAEWLNSPPFFFNQWVRITAFITSALMAVIFLGGFSGLIPWSAVAMWVIPLVGFHSAVGLLFRARVNETTAWLRPVSVETQVLREGLRLLEERPFQSLKLRRIADRVRNSSRSVRKLERLLNALNERNKDWFYAPSLFLLVGTQLCMAIENWRIENGAALRKLRGMNVHTGSRDGGGPLDFLLKAGCRKRDERARHRQNGRRPDIAAWGKLGKLRPIGNRPLGLGLCPNSGGYQPPRRIPSCPTSGEW